MPHVNQQYKVEHGEIKGRKSLEFFYNFIVVMVLLILRLREVEKLPVYTFKHKMEFALKYNAKIQN